MYTVSQINGQSKKSAGNHGNHKRSVPSIPPYHLSLTFMGIENKHFVPVTFTVKCGMDATQLLKSTHCKKLSPNALLCGSHIKIWNLANPLKKWNKEYQTLSFQFFINNYSLLMLFVLFFHVVCKISSFNIWTAKHLAQVSCTELSLWFMVSSISCYVH